MFASIVRFLKFAGRVAAVLSATAIVTLAEGPAAFAESPPPEGVINVNTASADQLMLLPRVGEERARRIIEARTKTPFKSVNELTRVKGIGLKTLRMLKPWVRTDGPTTLASEVRGTDPSEIGTTSTRAAVMPKVEREPVSVPAPEQPKREPKAPKR